MKLGVQSLYTFLGNKIKLLTMKCTNFVQLRFIYRIEFRIYKELAGFYFLSLARVKTLSA